MNKNNIPPEFFAVMGMLCGAAISLIFIAVELIFIAVELILS